MASKFLTWCPFEGVADVKLDFPIMNLYLDDDPVRDLEVIVEVELKGGLGGHGGLRGPGAVREVNPRQVGVARVETKR